MSPETLRKRQCFLPCSAAEDCFEKKCCLTEEELSLLKDKEPSIGHHGHSHGAGHSHSSGAQKSAWSWKNPLKRSTISLNIVQDESPHSHSKHLPQSTHFHGDKSNPDLSQEKDLIVVDTKLMKLGASTVHKTNHSSDELFDSSEDDDDENKVRKPMI